MLDKSKNLTAKYCIKKNRVLRNLIRYITGNGRLKTVTMKCEIIESLILFSKIIDAILGRRATSWSVVGACGEYYVMQGKLYEHLVCMN